MREKISAGVEVRTPRYSDFASLRVASPIFIKALIYATEQRGNINHWRYKKNTYFYNNTAYKRYLYIHI